MFHIVEKEEYRVQRTDEQKMERVRQYIIDYQLRSGKSPSYREIEKQGIVNGIASVSRIVLALQKRGLVEKTNIGQIGIPVQLRAGGTMLVQHYGVVPCGEPQVILDEIEGSYELPVDLFGKGDKFILKAKGDSMIKAGISHGDWLVVEKRQQAEDGEIVVAIIDGFGDGEATTKRYYKEKDGRIRLHPENDTLQDMYYNADQVRICGVVKRSIKEF